MTRLQLLQLVVGKARTNGFEFRRWYTHRLGLPWISAEAALHLLDTQRRYYALLFAHEFASSFWKSGTEITFDMPAGSFERRMPDGSRKTITRKPFIRRSARKDVWRYHLREMALAEEPLRYLRKYLHIEEQLDPEPADAAPKSRGTKRSPRPTAEGNAAKRASGKTAGTKSPAKRAGPRPLPAEPPAFLKRPYLG